MKITNLEKAEKVLMPLEGAKNTYKQVPISKNDGTPSHSVRVFTIGSEGHTPFHSHNFEHINYIINGKGAVVTGDGKELSIGKGDFVLVLPDEIHQYRNKSEIEPLVLICAVPKEYE